MGNGRGVPPAMVIRKDLTSKHANLSLYDLKILSRTRIKKKRSLLRFQSNHLLPCNLLLQSVFKHTFFPLRYFQMLVLVPRTCILCLPSCLVSTSSSNLRLALSLLKTQIPQH